MNEPRLTTVRVDWQGNQYRLDTFDPAFVGAWLRQLTDVLNPAGYGWPADMIVRFS